jgi:hypothetical protein
VARSPLVGRWDNPTATPISKRTTAAANAQRGDRRVGQPLLRIGTNGGSVVADCIYLAPFSRVKTTG